MLKLGCNLAVILILTFFFFSPVSSNTNILRSGIKKCYVCDSLIRDTIDTTSQKDCEQNDEKVLAKYVQNVTIGGFGYPVCYIVKSEYTEKINKHRNSIERGVTGEIGGNAVWKATFGHERGCYDLEDTKENKKVTVCLCFTNLCNWKNIPQLNVAYKFDGSVKNDDLDEFLTMIIFVLLYLVILTFVCLMIYCGRFSTTYKKKRAAIQARERAKRKQQVINISQQDPDATSFRI